MAIDETSKTLGHLISSSEMLRSQTKDQWAGLEALEQDVNAINVSIKGTADAVADLEEEVARLGPIVSELKEAKIKAYFFLALIGMAGGGLSIAGAEIGQIIGLWS
jgi:uncharacterized protein YoxC